MLRRLTWASAGLVVGFGASKWLEHEAKKRLRRYLPAGLPELRERVLSAAEEGRRAMESREAELRAQLFHEPRP
jgi:hypothetical protein